MPWFYSFICAFLLGNPFHSQHLVAKVVWLFDWIGTDNKTRDAHENDSVSKNKENPIIKRQRERNEGIAQVLPQQLFSLLLCRERGRTTSDVQYKMTEI